MSARSEILRRIGEDPALLGPGIQWVRGALPLRDGLRVDAVLKDAQDHAILLLAEDAPQDALADLTGRLVLVHGEVRASRPLLEELLQDRGLQLDHLLLVVPRAPDALLASARMLKDPTVEVRSLGDMGACSVEAPEPVPVASPEPEPVATQPEPQPEPEPVEEPAPPPPRVVTRAAADSVDATNRLLAEAKRRILRVSDAVEAEVDGALTRYRVRDQRLAVLEEGEEGLFHLHVGRPLTRRPIHDSRDLSSALDEILAQFLAGGEGPGERRVS